MDRQSAGWFSRALIMADVDARLATHSAGLVIGAAASALVPSSGGSRRARGRAVAATALLDPIGQVFLRMLFFVVIRWPSPRLRTA
jgi:hypothetical protein